MEKSFRSACMLGMMCIILKLFILLTFCDVVRGQCDNLKISSGNTTINASTVCNQIYGTSECVAFYETFSASKLPEGYPKSDSSVEKPSDIKLDGLESPYNNFIYPGVSIKWKSPWSGTARRHCDGYLVIWQIKNTNDVKCRLLHMERGNDTELTYLYNVPFVNQSVEYTVRVYSMPVTFDLKSKDNEGTFVHLSLKTVPAYSGYPGDWAPFLAYRTFPNGTIFVSISLPPAHFNISQFYVYLMNGSNPNPVFEKLFDTEPRTESNTDLSLNLTAVNSGKHTITVWVNDMFHKQEGLCQCWIRENGRRTCKHACNGSEVTFYMNVTDPPNHIQTPASTLMSTPTLTSTFTSTEDPSIDHSEGLDQDVPVAAIVGAVFALVAVLIIIIVGVCLFRNKNKVKRSIPDWLLRRCQPDLLGKSAFGENTFPERPTLAPLTRKTVYIMSADDHEAHVELAESFAEFLRVHCYCKVILPSDSDQHVRGLEWFLTSVSSSDYLIFINSEGAEKLTKAYLSKMAFQNRQEGPQGDLFDFGLKHILGNKDVRETNLVLVSFYGNHCQKYLQASEIFMLPKYLHHFLQKIHKLDAAGAKIYDSMLPMNVENIPKLSEGARMLAASKSVKMYQQNNPHWFESTFGDLKPQKPPACQRLPSDKSGDSAYESSPSDCSDSVSQHIFDSPTSIPSVIHFDGDFDLDGQLSCFTITEVRETMLGKPVLQESEQNEYSFIPPESISQIHCDSHSKAMAEINKNNEVPERSFAKSGLRHLQPKFDEYSIIPPELGSQVHFDSDRRAMAEINRSDEESFSQELHPPASSKITNSCLEAYEDLSMITVIPPDNPLDIQVDSLSTAFEDINADSYNIALKGSARLLMLRESENSDIESQFDSVSI